MTSQVVFVELKRAMRIVFLIAFLLSSFAVSSSVQAAAAGFSEYYIPGSVSQLMSILDDIETSNIGTSLTNVTTVSIGADNVTVYYDHWENGYGNGSTGNDEVYIANEGDVLTFRSNIATTHGAVLNDCAGSIFPAGGSPAGAATRCYDGRDRIYVAGGGVSVAQAFWPVTSNTNYANAWEIYPIKPYQTTYTIPVGENLYAANSSFADFLNVYVIVQATSIGTTNVQINDPGSAGVEVNVNLNRGETTQLFHIDAGTTVTASSPVQVQFMVGEDIVIPGQNNSRGYTAVPSSLWSSEYYSAVPGFAGGWDTDLFIYNPTGAPLTINYEDSLGSGSFVVAANSAESYQANVGRYVPANSAVYLEAADGTTNFWAIGSVDAGSPTFNWGFALLPPDELTSEYYISWAPGGWNQAGAGSAQQSSYSPLYVTPVNDNTTIFVDNSPADGVVDQTFTLDRIEMQRIFDTFDADNTGLHVWATGPIAIVWGEDPSTSPQASPGLDAGYTILPLNQDWIEVALVIDKSADPSVVPASAGAITTFTLVTMTDQFGLQDVSIVDDMPPGWSYVTGTTVITLPGGSTITGVSADPDIAGQQLTWDEFPVDPLDMNGNETLTIQFQAEATGTPAEGFYINEATATGTNGTETFTSSDTAVVEVVPAPGAITGTVWADTDNDGIGDTPIGGVVVELLDEFGNPIDSDPDTPGVQPTTTTTNPDGTYSFTDVPAGNYFVQETQPTGYDSVSDVDGGDPDLIGDVTPITVVAGETNSGNDFIEEQPGAITGTVWADTDNDDIGDTPIGGVVLELLDEFGNPIDSDPDTPGIQPTTTTTNPDGTYSFTNVPPGNYQVQETQPAGYNSVGDVDGGDLDIIGDNTLITVNAGETNSGNDFVEEQPGSISGQVRYDGDNDGDPSDADSAIVGVTIELLDGAGNPIDSDPNTPGIQPTITVTDSNGNYSFTNLPPGDYIVVETNPTGYTSTYDLDGAGNTLDQIAVTLGAGQDSTGNDFLDTSIPHIDVEKDPPSQTVASGTNVNFTITVTNDGSIDLDPVVVTDAQCDVLTQTDNGNGNTTLEISETWTYTCTVNNVTVDFTNTVSAVGTPAIGPNVSDNDTAEVDVLPTISVIKDASVASVPETGGSVTFTYTVTNTGTVGVTITSLSDDQFGTLTGDVDCQVGTPLAPSGSCSFDFITTLTGSVGTPHVNVFTANAEDDDGNVVDDDDDATVNFTAAPDGISKTIVDTNNDSTDGADVAIGEIVTYQVAVNVPPGDFSNFQLVDEMERGLAFVECVSITPSSLTTDIAGSFDQVCANPTTDAAGLPMDVDRVVRYDFGTLSNSGQTDATLTVTYRAIVLDIATNDDGVILNNSAYFSWSGGDTDPAQTTVTIVEPDLQITKTADVNFIANGSEVTFTLTISHTGDSSTDAFDVVVTDILPTGLTYVDGSVDCSGGAQDPDVECAFDDSNPAQPTIRAEWSAFTLAGGNGQVSFRVVGNASIPSNGNVTNTANVEWTSMPGDQTTPNSFSDPANPFATERYYDPADLINLYGDEDTLTLTRLGGGGGGGGGGNNNPPTTPVASSFLIPVTGFAPDKVTPLSTLSKPTYSSTNLTIEIPVINMKTSIVGVGLKNGEWDVSWLQNQAGWLEGSAYPTWAGNSVITAHSVNKDGKAGVFSKLKALKAGEYIFVYNNGYRYTYKVVSNAVVKPNDIYVLGHEEKSYLTLITCDNYDEVTGAYLSRIAVRAVLVDVKR